MSNYMIKMDSLKIQSTELKLITNNKIYQKQLKILSRKPGIPYYASGVNILFISKKHCVIEHFPNFTDKEMFSDDSVDTVSTALPFSTIDSMIIFPEQGEWFLDKIIVNDIYYSDYQEYICNDIIGTSAVPAAQVIKNIQKYDHKAYEDNMKEYSCLKKSLSKNHIISIFVGSILINLLQNDVINQSYIAGSILSIIYWYMVQKEVDLFGSQKRSIIQMIIFSSMSRLIVLSFYTVNFLHLSEKSLLAFTLAFFSYKIPVLIEMIYCENN